MTWTCTSTPVTDWWMAWQVFAVVSNTAVIRNCKQNEWAGTLNLMERGWGHRVGLSVDASKLQKTGSWELQVTVGVFHSFTWLRNNHENTIQNLRENTALQHQASVKNRRLAQQMERRPAVMAALKLKKVSSMTDLVSDLLDRILTLCSSMDICLCYNEMAVRLI
jgi:hypothetical protein